MHYNNAKNTVPIGNRGAPRRVGFGLAAELVPLYTVREQPLLEKLGL